MMSIDEKSMTNAWPYLLTELPPLDELAAALAGSARLRYTCLDISPRYLALGANTGAVYVFCRETLRLLQVVLADHAQGSSSLTMLAFGPNDNYYCSANSSGVITVVELNVDRHSKPEKVKTSTEHDSSSITSIEWDCTGSCVFVGDSLGRVSMIVVPTSKAKDLFTLPSQVILRLDSVIVQMDWSDEKLLVSTRTRCYLCFTSKHQYSQIGKKLRDGHYGACFFSVSSSQQMPNLYSARPGSRIWKVDFEGNVVHTHQFKELLAIPPRPIIKNSSDAILWPSQEQNTASQSLAFPKLIPFCGQYLLTWTKSGLYIFDPVSVQVILWTDQIKGSVDVVAYRNEIYIFDENRSSVTKLLFLPIEKCVNYHVGQRHWIIAGELCSYFQDYISNMRCRKHVQRELLEELEDHLLKTDHLELSNCIRGIIEGIDEITQKLGIDCSPGNLNTEVIRLGSGIYQVNSGKAADSDDQESITTYSSTSSHSTSRRSSQSSMQIEKIQLEDVQSCNSCVDSESIHSIQSRNSLEEHVGSSDENAILESNSTVIPDSSSIPSVYPEYIHSTYTNALDFTPPQNSTLSPLQIETVTQEFCDSDSNQWDINLNKRNSANYAELSIDYLPTKSMLRENSIQVGHESRVDAEIDAIPDACDSERTDIAITGFIPTCPSPECDGLTEISLYSDVDEDVFNGRVRREVVLNSDWLGVEACGDDDRVETDWPENNIKAVIVDDTCSTSSFDAASISSTEAILPMPTDHTLAMNSCVGSLKMSAGGESNAMVTDGRGHIVVTTDSDDGIDALVNDASVVANKRNEPIGMSTCDKSISVTRDDEPIVNLPRTEPIFIDGKDEPIVLKSRSSFRRKKKVTKSASHDIQSTKTEDESFTTTFSKSRSFHDQGLDSHNTQTSPSPPAHSHSPSTSTRTESPVPKLHVSNLSRAFSRPIIAPFLSRSVSDAMDTAPQSSFTDSWEDTKGTLLEIKDSISNKLTTRTRSFVKSLKQRAMVQKQSALIDSLLDSDVLPNITVHVQEPSSADVLTTLPFHREQQPVDTCDLEELSKATKRLLLDPTILLDEAATIQLLSVWIMRLHKTLHRYHEVLYADIKQRVTQENDTEVTERAEDANFNSLSSSVECETGTLKKIYENNYDRSPLENCISSGCAYEGEVICDTIKSYTTDMDNHVAIKYNVFEAERNKMLNSTELVDSASLDSGHDQPIDSDSLSSLTKDVITNSPSPSNLPHHRVINRVDSVNDSHLSSSTELEDSSGMVSSFSSENSYTPNSSQTKAALFPNVDYLIDHVDGTSEPEFDWLSVIYINDPFRLDKADNEIISELVNICFQMGIHGSPLTYLTPSSQKCDNPSYVLCDTNLCTEDQTVLSGSCKLEHANTYNIRPFTASQMHHVNSTKLISPLTSSSPKSPHYPSIVQYQKYGNLPRVLQDPDTHVKHDTFGISNGTDNLSRDMERNDDDCEMAAYLRSYFHFLDLDIMLRYVRTSVGDCFLTWSALVKCLQAVMRADMIDTKLEDNDVTGALGLLRSGTVATNKKMMLGYVARLFKMSPYSTISLCAEEANYITSRDVLYLIRTLQASVDTEDEYLYQYIQERLKRANVNIPELCADRQVRMACLQALLSTHHDDISPAMLFTPDRQARPGSHLLSWNKQSLLDMIIERCKSHADQQAAYQLCKNNGYWLGCLRLLALLGDKKHEILDLILSLDDIILLENDHGNTTGYLPLAEQDWIYLLARKCAIDAKYSYIHMASDFTDKCLPDSALDNDISHFHDESCINGTANQSTVLLNSSQSAKSGVEKLSDESLEVNLNKETRDLRNTHQFNKSDISGKILPIVESYKADEKEATYRNVGSQEFKYQPITWDGVASLIAKDLGPVRCSDILQGLSLPEKALTPAFYQRMVVGTLISKQKTLMNHAMLEKIDAYLWARRPTHMAPQLCYLVEQEKHQTQTLQDGSSTNNLDPSEFSYLESHPAFTQHRFVEDSSIQWGVHTDIYSLCSYCGLALSEQLSISVPGTIIFQCGHGFHKVCGDEVIVCDVCEDDIFAENFVI